MAMGDTILVVEDDVDIRFLVTTHLHLAGFTVVEATTAAEALDLLAGAPPAAMVTDLGLPGMDGADLVGRVRRRAQTRGLPIVVLTAVSNSDRRVRDVLREEGVALHFKPPDWASVLADLRRLINAT